MSQFLAHVLACISGRLTFALFLMTLALFLMTFALFLTTFALFLRTASSVRWTIAYLRTLPHPPREVKITELEKAAMSGRIAMEVNGCFLCCRVPAKRICQTDSDAQKSSHAAEALRDVPEDYPIRGFFQQRKYDTSFITLLEQFVPGEKRELEERIRHWTAAQYLLKRWEEFTIQEGPTLNLGGLLGHDATLHSSVNEKKELEKQTAIADDARGMLQNLERILACLRNPSTVDANAVGGWGIAGLQTDDPGSWNTVGRQMFQEILPLSPNGSRSSLPVPTTFLMAIHRPEGRKILHVAKLDTGAKVNLIIRELVTSIGLHVEAYTGQALQPIGPLVSPEGQVTLDWHVSGKNTTHKTTFAILEEPRPGFDILLSEQEIQKHRFFVQNSEFYYIE
ncbi:MAG: hypothetical protein Q9196_007200 [Gyalolechia fulgens]